MINRQKKDEIAELLQNFPAVAILGPRQVGKTTLARQIAADTGLSSVFLDLEDEEDLRKLDDAALFLIANSDKLVVIDEVQVMPRLFSVLRPLIDKDRRCCRFLLLGSASPELVKGVSESLAGRIAYVELSPIGNTEAATGEISQETLWLRGGFPDSLLARSERAAMQWRQYFIKSYVERELSAMFHVQLSERIIRNFWQMLAHYQGGMWNAQTFANSLGITGPTVNKYLDYLTGAFLLRSLEPWHVNTTKRIVKTPKIYIRDSGLLHALHNLSAINQIYGHPIAGMSWEGFCIQQILQELPDDIRPFFYRTHHGAEADLVLVRGIQPVAAIEIKLTNAPSVSKGFYQSIEDLQVKKAFVITPSSAMYEQKQHTVCSLRHFIKNELNILIINREN